MRSFVIGIGFVVVACGGSGSTGGGDKNGSNSCDAGTTPQMIKGTPVNADELNPWQGNAIAIVSQNGDLTVLGDSQDGKVHITATPFVMAAPCDSAIAAALADVASGIVVASTGQTGCSYAAHAHGSIPRASTGCVDVVVHVPKGTSDKAVQLNVHTFNGPLTIRSVNLTDHDCFVNGSAMTCPLEYLMPPTAQADNGDITISDVTGSVVAQSGHGNVTVGITPNAQRQEETPFGEGTRGSYVIVSSTNGNASLALPSNFTADSLSISAYQGTATVVGFPDLNPNSLERLPKGGSMLITLMANKGNVTLSSL